VTSFKLLKCQINFYSTWTMKVESSYDWYAAMNRCSLLNIFIVSMRSWAQTSFVCHRFQHCSSRFQILCRESSNRLQCRSTRWQIVYQSLLQRTKLFRCSLHQWVYKQDARHTDVYLTKCINSVNNFVRINDAYVIARLLNQTKSAHSKRTRNASWIIDGLTIFHRV
jgi:hypothetical protein